VRTALRFLIALIRRRALELEGVPGTGGSKFLLTPDGRIMPRMAGAGDPTPEEEAEAAQKAAELERAEAEAAAKKAEEEDEEPIFEGDLDKERAERLVRNERRRNAERVEKARAAAKKAKAETEKAKARARELEQEQESEHETAKREAGEAKEEADRQRRNAERLAVTIALREAAADLEVPAKKVKRMLKLVDRDDLKADDDGEVDGATEAVEAVLEEFPEFKSSPAPEPGDGDAPAPEPAGGNPARGKKPPKELSAADARKLAKDDPEKFHQLLDEGKLKGALAGK
jgi:colicin import membrane protein